MSFCIIENSKPGVCPDNAGRDKTECPPPENSGATCLFDTDCAGTKKCCSDGCNLICTDATLPPTPNIVTGPPGDPGEKGEPVCELTL